jgi:uncharacterized membrane protein YidH (DUF202 family)
MANRSDPLPPPPAREPVDLQAGMAAERTWLAWWRTALVASAGALAVGRLTPRILHAATWPYVALGVGYGILAVGMLLAGAARHRHLQQAAARGTDSPLDFALVRGFTIGGVVLTACTVVLVVAQS